MHQFYQKIIFKKIKNPFFILKILKFKTGHSEKKNLKETALRLLLQFPFVRKVKVLIIITYRINSVRSINISQYSRAHYVQLPFLNTLLMSQKLVSVSKVFAYTEVNSFIQDCILTPKSMESNFPKTKGNQFNFTLKTYRNEIVSYVVINSSYPCV